MRVCMCVCAYVCVKKAAHLLKRLEGGGSYIHTYIHTHIHTYIHTYKDDAGAVYGVKKAAHLLKQLEGGGCACVYVCVCVCMCEEGSASP